MSINLELYNFFCSIAEYGSFSEASSKLYISQPAITQRIHNLEMQLNTKLFYRTAKGVKLTRKGEELYQTVKEPVELLKNIEIEEKTKQEKDFNELNIAVFDKLFEINFLDEILTKFYKLYPNIKVNIYTSKEKEEVLDLDVNLIFVSNPKKIRRKNIKIEDSIVLHPCFYTSSKYYQKWNEKIDLNHNNSNNILILPREDTEERKILNQIIKQNNIKIRHYYEANNSKMKNILLKNELGIAFGFKENILDELQKEELVEIKTEFEMKEYIIHIIEKNIVNSSQIPNISWKYLKAI